jgi:hypothetical protein
MAKSDEQTDPATMETREHQPTVETPQEITTQKAADKATPEERRAAMAQENMATQVAIADDKDRQTRTARAMDMAKENAVAGTPTADDEERKARAVRMQQMARGE